MPDGTTKTAEQSRYPVSNYEHEVYQNELKRQILLPTNSLVDLMIDEFEDQIAYEPHPELDDVNNKKTPLSIAARFVDVAGFVSASVSRQSAATSTTTFDYGPYWFCCYIRQRWSRNLNRHSSSKLQLHQPQLAQLAVQLAAVQVHHLLAAVLHHLVLVLLAAVAVVVVLLLVLQVLLDPLVEVLIYGGGY